MNYNDKFQFSLLLLSAEKDSRRFLRESLLCVKERFYKI